MKKLFFVLMVFVFLLTACGGGKDAEPTPIPVDTAVPTVEIEQNEAAESVAEDTEAGTERVSPVDGMVQVFVPAGSFRMGALDADASPDEKPDHQVTLSAFWLDKLEVTNAMYMICVQAGACEPPAEFKSEKHDTYFNTDEYADFPVIYVTWGDANDYCSWAGKRLPTEAEWERAARGDDFRNFPWGDERPGANQANFNRQVNDVTRVGSFPAGASPYGVLDMSGNVWEWVSDYYDQDYYIGSPATNPSGPLAAVGPGYRRVIRGGSYQDVEKDIRVSSRGFESGPNPDAADMDSVEYLGESSYKIGFRCASDN
ncbi:MAG TPA: hypothetical protein EYP74_03545 [Anaerolineales bacterium]|nr:hypothetical protein [Anaerolineales bacterium]